MNNLQILDWLKRYPHLTSCSSSPEPLLMGILNITPDSFSDGGCFINQNAALCQVLKMIKEGADIIDIGGESSRPGALPVSLDEELERVLPIIQRIRQESDIAISIDTTKAEVMKAAIAAGADFINDIAALENESTLRLVAGLDVPVFLMHMRGLPITMQENTSYSHDIVTEINEFFQARIERCIQAGIAREHLIIDPGFGFGKSVQQNLELTRHIGCFKKHGLPVMLGASRKSTLGAVLNKEVHQRLIGGIAVMIFAVLQGVSIVRTHDLDEAKQALTMIRAITQAENLHSRFYEV